MKRQQGMTIGYLTPVSGIIISSRTLRTKRNGKTLQKFEALQSLTNQLGKIEKGKGTRMGIEGMINCKICISMLKWALMA